MFRLARSSSQKRELPTPEELVGLPPSLMKSVDELVGEADEATSAIDALELDDEELRTRSIVEQVGEMVNANPDEASRLVSRWIAAQE
jgi:flagellar biosynthesis/type III secretory pathway M-ring protein FliF/YscJ